tara:strand:- start:1089 stop:2474 length:1386 start_codon:yes stop_codon:yes gene_type:complete
MGITEKFDYLAETKALILDALVAGGADLDSNSTFRSYVDAIIDQYLIENEATLILDYENEVYEVFDSTYNARVKKPLADIINNYSAPAGRTYFDAAGVLQTAGTDEFIRAYDPATGEFLGNQIWGSYNNLFPDSLDFFALGWAREGCALAANVVLAPDGTMTGSKISENSTNGNHRLASQTVSGSGRHVVSFIVKPAERTQVILFLYDGNQRRGQTHYNLSTGTVVNGNGTIKELNDGWFKISIDTSDLNGTNVRAFLSMVYGIDSYMGDGSSGIYVWNAMLSTTTLGPELITTGSAVTVAAENQIIESDIFSDAMSSDDCTVLSVVNIDNAESTSKIFYQFYRASNERWNALVINGNAQSYGTVASGGGQWSSTHTAVNIGNTRKVTSVASISTTNVQFAVNGTLSDGRVAGIVIPDATSILLGRGDGNNATYLNGYLKKFVILRNPLPREIISLLSDKE